MPGTPKPDAVLLVLDSLHLTRQLMLAAPVLALGIPTLILLNMSDLMEARGGHIDPSGWPANWALLWPSSAPSTAPAWMPFRSSFTSRPIAPPPSRSRSRARNAASAHTWAAQVSRRTGYRAPLSVEGTRKIDNLLLHRIWGRSSSWSSWSGL